MTKSIFLVPISKKAAYKITKYLKNSKTNIMKNPVNPLNK